MKIALVVPGGVGRSREYRVIPCLLWLIERLARVHEVHVFALRQEKRAVQYPLLGAQIHCVGARFAPARAVVAILSEHRKSPFQVVHAVWAAHPGVIACIVHRLAAVPVLLHVTGGDLAAIRDIKFGLLARPYGRSLLRLAVSCAGHVTVPSHFLRERAEALQIQAERLPFGVAGDKWPVRPPQPRDGSRPAHLIQVADLNRVKDQPMLLRAMRALRDEGVPFHLDIVGVDTLRGEIQRLAAQLHLTDCVSFRGYLPHREMRPLVERADILVVSSRYEADPIVALEAAMCGVPTVGTAVGHIADWAPTAAVSVPVGDHHALARGIVSLLENEPRRIEIARAAQARARGEDADWTAGRVMTLYDKLAATKEESR